MPKSTYSILATFTSSEHGLTSACRAWSPKSPGPLWTPPTARQAHIPTVHGATSTLRSTSCERSVTNYDFNLDPKEEKKDDTHANIPNCFACNCRTPTDSCV